MCHKTTEQIIKADTFFEVLTLSMKRFGCSDVLSLEMSLGLLISKLKKKDTANAKEFKLYN